MTPVVGAAVVYGTAEHVHHIGIVETVKNGKQITTIEGNTTGGPGFNRNGCGTFRKTGPWHSIQGYILPIAAKDLKSKKK